jgi:hypothetical protein
MSAIDPDVAGNVVLHYPLYNQHCLLSVCEPLQATPDLALSVTGGVAGTALADELLERRRGQTTDAATGTGAERRCMDRRGPTRDGYNTSPRARDERRGWCDIRPP